MGKKAAQKEAKSFMKKIVTADSEIPKLNRR